MPSFPSSRRSQDGSRLGGPDTFSTATASSTSSSSSAAALAAAVASLGASLTSLSLLVRRLVRRRGASPSTTSSRDAEEETASVVTTAAASAPHFARGFFPVEAASGSAMGAFRGRPRFLGAGAAAAAAAAFSVSSFWLLLPLAAPFFLPMAAAPSPSFRVESRRDERRREGRAAAAVADEAETGPACVGSGVT